MLIKLSYYAVLRKIVSKIKTVMAFLVDGTLYCNFAPQTDRVYRFLFTFNWAFCNFFFFTSYNKKVCVMTAAPLYLYMTHKIKAVCLLVAPVVLKKGPAISIALRKRVPQRKLIFAIKETFFKIISNVELLWWIDALYSVPSKHTF